MPRKKVWNLGGRQGKRARRSDRSARRSFGRASETDPHFFSVLYTIRIKASGVKTNRVACSTVRRSHPHPASMCPLRVLVLALSVMVAAFTLYTSQVGEAVVTQEKSKPETVSNKLSTRVPSAFYLY